MKKLQKHVADLYNKKLDKKRQNVVQNRYGINVIKSNKQEDVINQKIHLKSNKLQFTTIQQVLGG